MSLFFLSLPYPATNQSSVSSGTSTAWSGIGGGEGTANEYRVSFQGNENTLKLDFSDACTNLYIYWKTLHCAMYELYLNFLIGLPVF